MRRLIRSAFQTPHLSSVVGHRRFPRCASVIQTKTYFNQYNFFYRSRHSHSRFKTKTMPFNTFELSANRDLLEWVKLRGKPMPPDYMSNALHLFRAIAPNGFDPSMRSYKLILQACSAASDARLAVSIVGEIVADQRKYIQLDCDCMESLLASCRCADPHEITADGVPLWQAVLMNVEKSLIHNQFLPSKLAYDRILRLCCSGEQLSLALSYAKNMMDLGFALSSINLDEMLILCKKQGKEHGHLVEMLKERSTDEIVFMRHHSSCKKTVAKFAEMIVDRCLRHNATLSGHTFASAMLRMHDGGRVRESLALLQSVLSLRACETSRAHFLPPPCKLVPMWRTCTGSRRLRRRTISSFVMLHKRWFELLKSSQKELSADDIFHGSLFWDMICKCTFSDDMFDMVQGMPHLGKILHGSKVPIILKKALVVCNTNPAHMEYLIRYMQEVGTPIAPRKLRSLVADFGRGERFTEMFTFMRFLFERMDASPALFSVAIKPILSSTSATRWHHAHKLEGMVRTHVSKPDPELLAQFATVYAQSDQWDQVLRLVDYMKDADVPRSLKFYSVVLLNKHRPRRRVPLQLVSAMNEDADAPGGFSWQEITEHFSCHDDLSRELVRMLELRYKTKVAQENTTTAEAPPKPPSRPKYDRNYQSYAQTPKFDHCAVPSVLYTNRLSMSYVFASLKGSPGAHRTV